MKRRYASLGFTLAELLIAVAILGVIAAMSIPGVLNAQENQKHNAILKEAGSTISQAYQLYKLQNTTVPTTLTSRDLSGFINYIKQDTVSSIDDMPTSGTTTCSVASPCHILSNGAAIKYEYCEFNGATSSNGLVFIVDPDGQSSTTKGIRFVLYYNGRLSTWGSMDSVTCSSGTFGGFGPSDPSWFHWD